jgi:methylated-DNA-[protein]-cysteine S-methyltransferase
MIIVQHLRAIPYKLSWLNGRMDALQYIHVDTPAGDLRALESIPHAQDGSEFYKDIWQTMSTIKPGNVLTYKELAAKSDHPEAIRTAGTACGQNRLILLVPCHRVVKSDGGIGNYLYGTKIKKYLLEHESRAA